MNFVSYAMAALDFTIPLERDLHEITLYFLAVRVIDLRKGSSYSFLILPGVPGGNLEDGVLTWRSLDICCLFVFFENSLE